MGTAGSRSPKGSSRSFRAGDEVRPRWKRQIRPTPRIAPAPCSCRMTQGNDLIRPRCARPPSPKRGRLHARCRLTNAEAASSRNLRPIRTHNTAVRPASRFTGRLFRVRKEPPTVCQRLLLFGSLGLVRLCRFHRRMLRILPGNSVFRGNGRDAGLPPRPAQGLTPPLHPRKGHRPLTLSTLARSRGGWSVMRPTGCSGPPIPSPAAPPAARRWWAPHP